MGPIMAVDEIKSVGAHEQTRPVTPFASPEGWRDRSNFLLLTYSL